VKIDQARQLPIVLSVSLICLGLSQWVDPAESSMRWKWFQDITNHLFGQHGHAKFLVFSGAIWLFWNLIVLFNVSSKGEK
jgi:hypothetical protein